MRTIPVVEAKSHFSGLLSAVESGDVVEITRYGRPVARLIPAPRKTSAEVLGGLWEQDLEFEVEPPEDPAPEPVKELRIQDRHSGRSGAETRNPEQTAVWTGFPPMRE